MAWAVSQLRIGHPGRWRCSSEFGAMGHMSCGVVGAAIATDAPAVAIVGDGTMLMQNEVSTAVQESAKAVWIVMNDSAYGMCGQGATMLGFTKTDCSLPQTDFAMLALAQGAAGITVRSLEELRRALREIPGIAGPLVIDVAIDPLPLAPNALRRSADLADMSGKGSS